MVSALIGPNLVNAHQTGRFILYEFIMISTPVLNVFSRFLPRRLAHLALLLFYSALMVLIFVLWFPPDVFEMAYLDMR